MSETFQFMRFLLGLRKARTSLTESERHLMAELARGRHHVVEIGVYEGATSAILCQAMDPTGRLLLIDPYEPALKIERLLGFSCTRFIAHWTVRPWANRVQFVRSRSLEAAEQLPKTPADLVFIDADHSYRAVREDFLAWLPAVAPEGRIALHDSRVCAARPDLTLEVGPVRLSSEIGRGDFDGWTIVDAVDSISVVGRSGLPTNP